MKMNAKWSSYFFLDPKNMNQEKQWKIATPIKDKKNTKYHWIIEQILANRNIKNSKEAECFIDSDYEKCTHDPFLFRDCLKAVELIIKHIVAKNKIIIYGDYDADGVTASAVLAETITVLKGVVDVYIPDRVLEGYGLNKNAVTNIASNDFKLIITVDGGIRSYAEVEYAKSIGIDVIITDHHTTPIDKKEIPNCLILNSTMTQETYPYKKLAGVGVAFKLAKALIQKTKLADQDKKILEYRLLDLVAIGTVADRVPLLDENRILVSKGLNIINSKKQRPGIGELIKVCGINGGQEILIDSDNIGFQIGPRINAAGRMGNATTAYELLITQDLKEATTIAERLNKKNIERKEETEKIILKAEELISQDNKILIAAGTIDQEWNEGIVGLVAGRISEKYYKPTLVITETKDGFKGSGRSVKEFNIMEALDESAKFLGKYGGHPSACGFSLEKENLDNFIKCITNYTNKKLKNIKLVPQIYIEAELELDELDKSLINEMEKLEPFGQEHAKPIFVSRDIIISDILHMGLNGNHIKIKLTNGRSNMINAIGFNQRDQWKDLRIGDKIDLAYYFELNKFNGRSEIQLKIIDIKKN